MAYRFLFDYGPFVCGQIVDPTTKACKLSPYTIPFDHPSKNEMVHVPELWIESGYVRNKGYVVSQDVVVNGVAVFTKGMIIHPTHRTTIYSQNKLAFDNHITGDIVFINTDILEPINDFIRWYGNS